MLKKAIPFLFIILNYANLNAQNVPQAELSAKTTPAEIHAGGKGNWTVFVKLPSRVHISDALSGLFFVRTMAAEGIHFEEPVYPKGFQESYGLVYRGNVAVEIPITVDLKATAGERMLSAEVQIQPCGESNGICYPPEIFNVSSKLIVLAADPADVSASFQNGIEGKLSHALVRGSILSFIIMFLGGMLTSLTPCVYPMIPVTVSVIGARASGGKRKGFVLSLFYVLGIALTFSFLGIIAAKTGSLFGVYSQHPAVNIVLAIVFFVMGLSLLGAFVLQMPPVLASKLRGQRRNGYFGVLVMGILAGLVVSPCVSPLLVVILTWVAKTGNMALGFGLLFSFALGMGVLFVVIGTFAGFLKNLPKTGRWTNYIEKGFGIILIALSVYFAFGSIRQSGLFNRHLKSEIQTIQEKNPLWIASDEEGFLLAKASGKSVLIDFYAEWCAACLELDQKTWPDSSLQRELSSVIRVKLDLSLPGEKTTTIQKKYNIIGMPTVILFSFEGKELGRFSGFLQAEEVKKFVRRHVRKDPPPV